MKIDSAYQATFEFVDIITNTTTVFNVENPINDIVEQWVFFYYSHDS